MWTTFVWVQSLQHSLMMSSVLPDTRTGRLLVQSSCPWWRLNVHFLRSVAPWSSVQYSTVQYSTVQYSTVQYSTVQYSTVQYSTVHYSTLQYTTVHYSTLQYTTVHYSTLQYTTVHYSTLQCNNNKMLFYTDESKPANVCNLPVAASKYRFTKCLYVMFVIM